MTYSDGDIDLATQSLLIQFYPILISTLLSIKRGQLSVFDAYFALILSLSPLAAYLSFASMCDLCGIRTDLFKRIKYYRNIVRTLGALVPLLWTALAVIERFSGKAFLDSPCIPALTSLGWLNEHFVTETILSLSAIGRFLPSGLGLVVLFPFPVLLFRRRSQMWAHVQLSLDGASRLHVPFARVKCAWYVSILTGPILTKSNARKLYYRPST